MIDLHLHILPGIDDGSRDMQESIKIAQNLVQLGFTGAFCTPHFIADSQQCADNMTKDQLRKKLQKAIDEIGLNFKLHAGNEIYIDPNIIHYIETREASVLGMRRNYVLFELPFYTEVPYLRDIIFEMKANGITPILAHPERYSYFQKDKKRILELVRMGVKLQCNFGSMVLQYGKKAKQTMKFLLKNRVVSFLGTDIHHADASLFQDFEKARKKIVRIIGEDEFQKLSHDNIITIFRENLLNKGN